VADTEAALEHGGQYTDQVFSGLNEHEATFEGLDLTGCTFDACAFSRCTFYRCVFVDCTFRGCDLSLLKVPNSRFAEVRFSASKLIGVDWTVAGDNTTTKLSFSVGFEDCVLDYSSFFGLSLRGVLLTRCSAKDVDFSEADLGRADCRGTDFTGSKFLHTDLSRADFRAARSYAIDPTANTVKQARFSLPEAVSLLRAFDVKVE